MTTYNKNASHSFAFIPRSDIKRNVFNRSHEYKTAFDGGYLVPIFVDYMLPGDTFDLNNLQVFCRLNNMITPIMDNAYLELFAFFVPHRLVWDHFKNFMGEKRNPTDTTDYLIPQVSSPDGGFAIGSVADYFGLPTGVSNLSVSALPFRACNLIYNDWFRDENLQNSLPVNYGDGPDNISDYPLFRRGKRHDYFTSCLPSPQKGDVVTLPLGDKADVYGITDAGMAGFLATVDNGNTFRAILHNHAGQTQTYFTNNGTQVNYHAYVRGIDFGNKLIGYADLSNATSASITEFRHAIQVQAFQELMNRGGSRYTEIVQSHFDTTSPDARLQRPELLGVSSMMLNVNSVPQTSSTDDISPQGNLAAYGVFSGSTLNFTKSFTEHGTLVIFANVRADLTYQQGIDRFWSYKTLLDFPWPILSNTSEQAVLNKEIFAQGSESDNGVFGYQERYAECRYFPSKITGKLRSSDPQSLDVWHLSQQFDALPKLNSEFIEDNPPFDRVVAVPSEPHFLLDANFNIEHTRPLPLFGIPASLGVHL